MMYPKYEEDLSAWAHVNAMLLKERKFEEADMEHIIEELETLSRSNKRELVNRVGVLIAHLMKWQYQPNYQNKKSWKGTILRQRIDISELLKENPSLKSFLNEGLEKPYTYALAILEEETPLDVKTLPKCSPYTLEQCLDGNFYPL